MLIIKAFYIIAQFLGEQNMQNFEYEEKLRTTKMINLHTT